MVCELYSEINLVVLLEDSACLSVRMYVYAMCAAKLCVSGTARDSGGESRVKNWRNLADLQSLILGHRIESEILAYVQINSM